MTKIITEILPHETLRPYVQCYWTGGFNVDHENEFAQSVLPNGCIELIIHTDSGHCELSGDGITWRPTSNFILIGLYERPYKVVFNEHVEVFGIRFYPDGFRKFFREDPALFASSYAEASAVLGKRIETLCARLMDSSGDHERRNVADAELLQLFSNNGNGRDYAELAMQIIRGNNGLAHYEAVVNQVPISQRQLQRSFKNAYGISMRNYIRLARFNTIHHYMNASRFSLSELSQELNFADQAHFIKEFKTYAGESPRRYLTERDNFIMNPVVQGLSDGLSLEQT